MLFTDVDKFKQINDKYGHPFGDKVLSKIAGVIREVFSKDCYCCRYGGDEYVILIKKISTNDEIKPLIKQFDEKLLKLGEELGLVPLTCSVGIAVRSNDRILYSEILSRADSALYIAKKHHINCVIIDKNGKTNEILSEKDKYDLNSIDAKECILIIDDSSVNRLILNNILVDKYEILEAEDGKEAFEILKNNSERISAILLDIIMPVMDGFEFLKKKREYLPISNIPVIVTTISDDEESEKLALSLGANDFLSKPYRHTIVVKRLENVIKLYRYFNEK